MAGPITTPVTTVKRSLPRRILRWVLRGLAGVIVLLVLAIAFLHTSWGKNVVRGVVEKRLAAKVNGSVRVGSLDYGFLFSSLSIGDIEIRNVASQPALAIAKVDLVIERSALLHKEIILDELTVTGLDARSPALKGLFKKSNSKPLGHVQIKRLAVTGKATITKPDGSVIAVDGLDLAGSVDARPSAQTLELALAKLAAKVDLPDRHVELALDGITVKKDGAVIDLAIAKVGAGAAVLEGITAHVDRKAQHALKITKARIDSAELAKLLGKPVLVDDVALDLTITGPESALVLAGTVATRDTRLVLSGKADVVAARPTYELDLRGAAKSADLTARPIPAVETDVRLHVAGSGRPPLDHEATIELQLGTTKVGTHVLDKVDAKILANRGAYTIERFGVQAVGFDIAASGTVSKDKQIDAHVGITGNVADAMTKLAAAGVKIPPRAPRLGKLDLAIDATGKLDGELGVTVQPTRIALAGGSVRIAGDATLANKKLKVAHANVTLGRLDLAQLARLAGRPPKAKGTLSGTLGLEKTPTSRDVRFAVDIALADKPLTVHATGTADLASAKIRADIATAGSPLATVDAKLPLDAKGFAPRGAWNIQLDVARRELASLAALLPGKKLLAGSVEVHATLGGSLARPTGTIAIAASTKQDIALTATLVPSANHLAVTTDGAIAMGGDKLAAIRGTVDMPYRLAGNKPDVAALRAGLVVDAVIDIPERTLASLATLRPKLATMPGTVAGTVAVKGALKTPAIDARIAWRGYTTASGKPGETRIAATGTPAKLVAQIDHGTLHVTADVDRSRRDRIAVKAKLRAAAAPLVEVIPSFVKVPPIELGTLDTNLDADVVLVDNKLDALVLAGTLDVAGAAVTIPNTKRRYHDITLSLAGEPGGLAIRTLTLHETDLQKRRIDVTGHLALDKAKPATLDLALVSTDWLVFGGDKLGKPDAPRATASFDIAARVDLTQPVIGVDATVKSLALLSPDRLERGHYFEKADLGGDILFVDGTTRPGKLPVAAVPAPKKRRPIDVRVHIPNAIHVEQTPLDLYAKGELVLAVRDEGIATRGELVMERGKVNLFGKDHALVHGKLVFDDAHPKGEFALEFARTLPNVAKRDLAASAGTANITFSGPPTKPKVTLHGAASAAMLEVMAMYNAGRPVNIARPGEPTSPMATAPRTDQWLMLTFMASNLPHLLFLDRITTWGEHRITNVEAERYRGKTHVRAVVRPPVPGRSENELQVDRVLVDTDRAAIGIGVRGGDRLGGGLGLFLEWSSD